MSLSLQVQERILINWCLGSWEKFWTCTYSSLDFSFSNAWKRKSYLCWWRKIHRNKLARMFLVEVKVSVCGLHIGTLWPLSGEFTVLGNQAASTKSPRYCERLTQKDVQSARFPQPALLASVHFSPPHLPPASYQSLCLFNSSSLGGNSLFWARWDSLRRLHQKLWISRASQILKDMWVAWGCS